MASTREYTIYWDATFRSPKDGSWKSIGLTSTP